VNNDREAAVFVGAVTELAVFTETPGVQHTRICRKGKEKRRK
jgi:hypothetical protein